MKKMTLLKTIIIVTFLAVMTAIVLSSCGVSKRGYGCAGQGGGLGYIGYK
tara:strand:- start:1 stop:150 length:150 start_codon:yes stop_codon:yes gene_type:complete